VAKKCKQCGVRSAEGRQYPIGWLCSDKCRDILIKQQWQKDHDKLCQKAHKEKVARDKAFKKKVVTHDVSYQLKVTQAVFNRLRKLQEYKWFADRGLKPYCISCGKEDMDWCCGHFKTVGSQGALRFDEMNTYLQCNRYCNSGLSANINGNKTTHGYIKGLEIRFGKNKAQEIIDYCEIDRTKKWTGEELISMRKLFNKEIKELI